jgi:hypothetical protein
MPEFDQFNRMFSLIQGAFVVFFVLVVGVIVFVIVKASARSARNAAAPEVSAAAHVLDKRIETSGGGDLSVTQRYFVSFEQPGGERFELEVPEREYGLLAGGDAGTVTMKGDRYLGFARELLR